MPQDAVLYTEPGGITVLEQDGICVRYLGYSPSAYSTKEFLDGVLLLYIENTTGRRLQCYISEAYLRDEAADLSLWCELPPQTRTVTSVYLYPLEDLGIDSEADLEALTFRLAIEDYEDYEFSILSDLIPIPAAEQGSGI